MSFLTNILYQKAVLEGQRSFSEQLQTQVLGDSKAVRANEAYMNTFAQLKSDLDLIEEIPYQHQRIDLYQPNSYKSSDVQ